MLHRPRGAQGGRREQAPREQGPPPRARRAFQRAGPPGESRPAFGTVGWGPSPPLHCGQRSPQALSVVPSHLMGFLWHWRAGRGLGGADLIILSFQKREKPRPQEERRAA